VTDISGIDTDAPVIARHEIEIAAPLEVVWVLQTDVVGWPSWNPDITDVASAHPLAPGVTFGWHTAGLAIRSTVYALTERSRILWGGTASGIVGIHEWRFAATANGVRVETEESWSGAPVEAAVAALQDGLDRSLVAWLRHLKTAAEATP
jgi:hypothetical protein